ncbi:MAG: AAA family ATPase [Candidatus Bathyarchaeota archaeon]|nr:MAG: AAA family ATPase [Candidatus Bathyarchaeota archaeon]
MIGKKVQDTRVRTGIPGMDDLLEGGFIRNSTVLLRGKAGSGKTIFGLQYLLYGALHDEPGILLSIEETKKDLYRESLRFGWNLEFLERQGKLAILEKHTQYSITIHEIEKAALRIGAKRVVVDSIPALFSSYPNELQPSEHRSAFHLLCQVLTDSCDCTVILISETDWSERLFYEEYVPKGVIELSTKMMEGIARKFLLIKKMREVRHSKREHLYEITDNGFTLFIPRTKYGRE